jgi:hypothetical protein
MCLGCAFTHVPALCLVLRQSTELLASCSSASLMGAASSACTPCMERSCCGSPADAVVSPSPEAEPSFPSVQGSAATTPPDPTRLHRLSCLLQDLLTSDHAAPVDMPCPLLYLVVMALHPVPAHRVSMGDIVRHPCVQELLACATTATSETCAPAIDCS